MKSIVWNESYSCSSGLSVRELLLLERASDLVLVEVNESRECSSRLETMLIRCQFFCHLNGRSLHDILPCTDKGHNVSSETTLVCIELCMVMFKVDAQRTQLRFSTMRRLDRRFSIWCLTQISVRASRSGSLVCDRALVIVVHAQTISKSVGTSRCFDI